VLIGWQAGASLRTLSEVVGISSSAMSRRHDSVRLKVHHDREVGKLAARIMRLYQQC
jgi:hypothetical protein